MAITARTYLTNPYVQPIFLGACNNVILRRRSTLIISVIYVPLLAVISSLVFIDFAADGSITNRHSLSCMNGIWIGFPIWCYITPKNSSAPYWSHSQLAFWKVGTSFLGVSVQLGDELVTEVCPFCPKNMQHFSYLLRRL